MTKQFSNPPFNTGSGAFMGFETSESESETEDIEKGVRQQSQVTIHNLRIYVYLYLICE